MSPLSTAQLSVVIIVVFEAWNNVVLLVTRINLVFTAAHPRASHLSYYTKLQVSAG